MSKMIVEPANTGFVSNVQDAKVKAVGTSKSVRQSFVRSWLMRDGNRFASAH